MFLDIRRAVQVQYKESCACAPYAGEAGAETAGGRRQHPPLLQAREQGEHRGRPAQGQEREQEGQGGNEETAQSLLFPGNLTDTRV